MLHSIAETARTRGENRIIVALLLQNCSAEALGSFSLTMPPFVQTLSVDGRLSLSAARNLLLRRLTAENVIGDDALVATMHLWRFPTTIRGIRPGFWRKLQCCSHAIGLSISGSVAMVPSQ
jgi:hypothetical protein